MNKMESKLKKYYEGASIKSVKGVTDSKGYYDYEKMFDSFGCPNKDDCRNACKLDYERKHSGGGTKFLFSPRTEESEGSTVSQYYSEKKYKGHRIPRIVVVSLSASEPMEKKQEQEEGKPFRLHPFSHWRGTTTTIRSLLDPFYRCLDPVEDYGSLKIIEKLFFHVRTAKCFSDVGGSGEEPAQLYENCGGYLSKEVSILEPDVIVTQGNHAHWQAEKYVFDENAKNTPVEEVEGIANSIARIVHLKEDNKKVYWLRSLFPGRTTRVAGVRVNFYSEVYAGLTVDSERGIAGAKRENFVRYGRDIKKFMDEEGR